MKQSIRLNVNMDTIIENGKLVELNINIASSVLRTQALRMI